MPTYGRAVTLKELGALLGCDVKTFISEWSTGVERLVPVVSWEPGSPAGPEAVGRVDLECECGARWTEFGGGAPVLSCPKCGGTGVHETRPGGGGGDPVPALRGSEDGP